MREPWPETPAPSRNCSSAHREYGPHGTSAPEPSATRASGRETSNRSSSQLQMPPQSELSSKRNCTLFCLAPRFNNAGVPAASDLQKDAHLCLARLDEHVSLRPLTLARGGHSIAHRCAPT